jgi:4-hydroxy-2-oxoheptanedioate aldolase
MADQRVLVTARAFWESGREAECSLNAAGFSVVRTPEAGPYASETLASLARDCDAVIGSSDQYDGSLFRSCPRLKIVSRCGVGIDSEAIYRVPGIDGMFVGPNDLLSSMGRTPAMETDDPEFVAALRRVRETAERCGIASGIHVADIDAAQRRLGEGWRFIAVASELALAASRRLLGGDVKNAARY